MNLIKFNKVIIFFSIFFLWLLLSDTKVLATGKNSIIRTEGEIEFFQEDDKLSSSYLKKRAENFKQMLPRTGEKTNDNLSFLGIFLISGAAFFYKNRKLEGGDDC